MFTFIKAEWKYWLRSPMTWILFFINALLIFGAVSSDAVTIGGGVGSVHKNAPSVIQFYYGVFSVFIGLFMTTAFMNATANRDFECDMYQLVFSSPIKKRDYFFGKFIGAYTMAIIPMLGVSLGALLGPLMPWTQPERYGPVLLNGDLLGILGFVIPNVFIIGVILYSMAILFRSTIVSFIGAMMILVFYSLSSNFTRDIQNEWLANILDPFGRRPEGILSKYATVIEQNLHGTAITGQFLYNRLIWMGLSALLLFFMYSRFSFSTKNSKAKKVKAAKPEAIYLPSNRTLQPDAANKLSFKLLLNLIKFETKTIIRNPTFIIIAVIGLINLTLNLAFTTGSFGEMQYPVTYHIIESIQGSYAIFIIAIITFYSGVLVWKERDAKIHEIQDASAVRTGILFSSKLIALIFTIGLVLSLTILIGVIAQLCYGYHRFELGLYVKYLLGLDLSRYAYLIVIALFFHYLINNRYIAYFAFIVFVILNSFLWGAMHIETNMVQYGAAPSVTYSDMNGFGPFVKGILWFKLYWALFAAIICYVIFSFYVRGKEYAFNHRWQAAKVSLKKNLAVFSVIVLAFIACSSFVYYNTKVLNKFDTDDESEKQSIDYEKTYKKYENAIQPRYFKINYKIDLQPQERAMSANIDAWVRNISTEPVKDLYFTMPLNIDSVQISVANATQTLNDKRLHFRILSLKQPLMPGDSLLMNISFTKKSPGFENEVSFVKLTENGTFFNSMDVLPTIGYNRHFELSDKNKRTKNKLPARKRMADLDDANTLARSDNYVVTDADWVNVNTVISTDTDQTAVAPGSLIRTWNVGGRKYFNYALDKASVNFYSFISARYQVARQKWNGIDIEVYYDKNHGVNVPNMLKSIQKSLEYYTTNYGPYFHKQCRIVEFPTLDGNFAQSFPGTMPYGESIGFITDLRDVTKDDIDFVFYVVAHEMGHQYWAHQVIGAGMQGSEMMSEGFAQYSALMVMEKEYGKDKMKKFLKYEMDGYLRGRGREFEGENPLIKTEGQQYIHYQKASVVMYYLKEMIGENKVNEALKSLIDSFAYKNPYPTSLSALRAFKTVTPDSLQYLISDMFENITLFSNRVLEADSKKTGDEYEVSIKTSSEKFRSDSTGQETSVPINDYIDIGVFAQSKNKKGLGNPIVIQRVKVNKKDNTYTFKVKKKPYQVGIDPYNYLIDRIPSDNLKNVN